MLSLASLACPSCALGEGQGRSGDSILLAVALVTLPLAVGLLTGFIIGRLVKRSSSSG
jgi:hypothetical protein